MSTTGGDGMDGRTGGGPTRPFRITGDEELARWQAREDDPTPPLEALITAADRLARGLLEEGPVHRHLIALLTDPVGLDGDREADALAELARCLESRCLRQRLRRDLGHRPVFDHPFSPVRQTPPPPSPPAHPPEGSTEDLASPDDPPAGPPPERGDPRRGFAGVPFEAWVPLGLLALPIPLAHPHRGLPALVDLLITGNRALVLADPGDAAAMEAFLEAWLGNDPRLAGRARVWPCDPQGEAAAAAVRRRTRGVVLVEDRHRALWQRALVGTTHRLLERGAPRTVALLSAGILDTPAERRRAVVAHLAALRTRLGISALYLEAPHIVEPQIEAPDLEEPRDAPRTGEEQDPWSDLLAERFDGEELPVVPHPLAPGGPWAPEDDPAPLPERVLLYAPAEDLPPLARRLGLLGVSRVLSALDLEDLDSLGALAKAETDRPLGELVRPLTVHGDRALDRLGRLDQLARPAPPTIPDGPITDRSVFDDPESAAGGQIFLRTGGSTGDPALATYTYRSFEIHTRGGGEAMVAAGLDPQVDRVMNLFTAGGLYSGFIGFFKALESVGARQLPMAMDPNLEAVGEMIVRYRVNVLLAMPPYAVQLFRANDELFRGYRGIEKIFYSSDHFDPAQARQLRERYGVELIRVGHYGSIDAGSLGFQCDACGGTVLHLHDHLQDLEILDRQEDRPVAGPDEVGRLVFTNRVASSESQARYDTGDLGRWIAPLEGGAVGQSERCACGRANPRFELLGREHDWFKASGFFMSYWRIARVLSEDLGYLGPVQLVISKERGPKPDYEHLLVRVDQALLGRQADAATASPERLREALLDHHPALAEPVRARGSFTFDVEAIPDRDFERSPSSGKIRHVVDERVVGEG